MFIEISFIIVSGLFIFIMKAMQKLENVCINNVITFRRYRSFISAFEEAIGRKVRIATENYKSKYKVNYESHIICHFFN